MSYDAKFTITRDKLSLTVELKEHTAEDLTLIATVAAENLQHLPYLMDQFFKQFESAMVVQKRKRDEAIAGGAVSFKPAAPVPSARKGRLPKLVKEQVKADLIENKLTLEEIALKYSLPLNSVKGVWGFLIQSGVVAQDTLSGSGNVAEAKP